MRIQIRQAASVAVLDLAGQLTAGKSAVCLTETVDALLTSGPADIVLNMAHVDLVDCAGIGQLVKCHRKARGQGGSLKLTDLSRRLQDLLRLFRLDTQLEIFETERDAAASLSPTYTGIRNRHLGTSRPGVSRRPASLTPYSQSQGAV